MRANKKIDEGWFRNWMDSQTGGEYSRLKGSDPNEIKNPKVLQQVAKVGFEDYAKRLNNEGINLNQQPSIDSNIDRIKESVVEYVQAYMTNKEQNDARDEILVNLKSIVDSFKALPRLDINSIKKFFTDCTSARADALFKLQARLKPSNKPPAITNKLPDASLDSTKITDMNTLMKAIPSNSQLPPFQFDVTLTGRKVIALIRSDGVYLTNLPANYEQYLKDNRLRYPAPESITYKNMKIKVYPVKTEKNLKEIYDRWLSKNGGTVPSPLPTEEIVGQLE